LNGPGTDTRLRLAGISILALLLLGTFAPRSAWYDFSFGLEAWRDLPRAALAAASFVLLALLLLPRLADRIALELGSLARFVPGRLGLLLLLGALTAAFLLLTNRRISGDAMSIVLLVAEGKPYPSNALTSYCQMLLAGLPGLDAREGVRLFSVVSGVVFALAAVGMARTLFTDRARRAGLAALLLSSGAGVLFFGTLEVYAPLAAGTAVYLYAGIRHLKQGGSLWFPALALGVTFCLHGSAGLLLPSLVLLANEGRIRPFRIKRSLVAAAGFLLPVAATFAGLFFLSWGGHPPGAAPDRVGNFLGALGQGPLLPFVKTTANLPYRYALFDLDHLVGVLNLVFLSAPVGVLLLLLGRRQTRDPLFRFLLVAAGFLVLFPVFWNISFPLRRDWDLFVNMGVPLTLLGGLLFFGEERRPGRILTVVAVSLFTFVPFVVANARAPLGTYAADVAMAFGLLPESGERNRMAGEKWERLAREQALPEQAIHEAAVELMEQGKMPEAEDLVRDGVSRYPESPLLIAHFGMLRMHFSDDKRARELFWQAVREEPYMLIAWLNLAALARKTGDNEEAVRILERGIRIASRDDRAAAAYDLLGRTLLDLGERRRAREAYALAESREGGGR
jgi:Tetratricopeptide repeat